MRLTRFLRRAAAVLLMLMLMRMRRGRGGGGAAHTRDMCVFGCDLWSRDRSAGAQLEACAALCQWNEAFRTVDDIMQATAAQARPKMVMMAMYYEKLCKIFAVSGNQLYHAYAAFKHYHLAVQYNKV